MSIIRYPVPYQVYGLAGRSTKPSVIDIADELAFEIPDLEAVDAPVTISMTKAWPHALYRSEFEQGSHDKRDAPVTALRAFEGGLYAPIVKHNRLMPEPEGVKPEEFRELFNSYRAATPMQHLYANHDYDPLRRYFAGQLKPLGQVPIRSVVDDVPATIDVQRRDFVVERAKTDAANIICIDGLLWQKLPAEPIIRYRADTDRRVVTLEIVLGEDQQIDRKGGYFRLDRLDDCRDHVVSFFPDFETKQLFRDLTVLDSDILHYNDDARALVWNARELEWFCSFDISEFTKAAGIAYYDLRELNEKHARNEEIDLDRLASAMATIADNYPTDRITPSIKSALERWKWRPTSGMGIVR